MEKLGWGRGNKRSVSLCVFIHVWIVRPAVDSTPRCTRARSAQVNTTWSISKLWFWIPRPHKWHKKSVWEKAKQNEKEYKEVVETRDKGEVVDVAKVPPIFAGLRALWEGPDRYQLGAIKLSPCHLHRIQSRMGKRRGGWWWRGDRGVKSCSASQTNFLTLPSPPLLHLFSLQLLLLPLCLTTFSLPFHAHLPVRLDLRCCVCLYY